MSEDFRDYRFRTKGDHIKRLQEALIDAGYELPKHGADGDLGSETMTAVQQFEADHSFVHSLSWVIEPTTLVVLTGDDCTEPEPPPANPNVPPGKGMFQRSWKHMGESPQEARDWIVEHGLKWVAVQRLWQYEDPKDDKWYNASGYNDHETSEWIAAIVDAGAQVWIWGWPHPGRQSDFVTAMGETAEGWGAVGIIADPEGPWRYATAEQGRELVDGLMATGLPVGISSYGAPWNFPSLPWEEFARADFGVPQIYDSSNNLPDDYPTRSVQAWTDYGFKHIVPASAAYNKTETQMRDLLERTPTPEDSIIWWDWYNANQASYRWRVIKDYAFADAPTD